MSEIRFDDKVAVITGAGAGLGKTYAMDLAKRGAKVVINDIGGSREGAGGSNAPADIVVEEIKNAGGEAVANYDSVATFEGGQNIIETAVKNYGKIDILINNAGIIQDHAFHKMTEEEWDKVIDVHLKGTFNTTRAAVPFMRENNYGRIVFTVSGVGLYGNFGQSNYAAAKMGMIGLLNTLRIEFAKYDIKVNAIAPNAASRMTKEIMPPKIFDKLKPEYITPIVTYLSSEKNTDTGMIFNCIGGWYSRTEIMCSPGIILSENKETISAEDIMENWDSITELKELKKLNNIFEPYGYISKIIS